MITRRNEERKKKDNMELLKQQASDCGPECGCHATGSSGRIRWVLGVIVLVAAVAVAARAMVKSNRASTQPSAPAFATPTRVQTPTPENVSAVTSVQVPKTSVSKKEKGRHQRVRNISGEKRALSELNAVAADVDGCAPSTPGCN